MEHTIQHANDKLAEVGHEAGFGWADKMLAMDVGEDEIRQIAALVEDPSSGWIQLTPVAGSRLAAEIGRWGLDCLDAGEPFCDGFVGGVVAAWYLTA